MTSTKIKTLFHSSKLFPYFPIFRQLIQSYIRLNKAKTAKPGCFFRRRIQHVIYRAHPHGGKSLGLSVRRAEDCPLPWAVCSSFLVCILSSRCIRIPTLDLLSTFSLFAAFKREKEGRNKAENLPHINRSIRRATAGQRDGTDRKVIHKSGG